MHRVPLKVPLAILFFTNFYKSVGWFCKFSCNFSNNSRKQNVKKSQRLHVPAVDFMQHSKTEKSHFLRSFSLTANTSLRLCALCHWTSAVTAFQCVKVFSVLYPTHLETTVWCPLCDTFKRLRSWNTWRHFFFLTVLNRKIVFQILAMVSQTENLLEHHIIFTTCRLESMDCWQLTGSAEQLSPRWTHFNYRRGSLPTGFHCLSRQLEVTKRVDVPPKARHRLPRKHCQSQVNAFLTTLVPQSCQGNTCSPASLS